MESMESYDVVVVGGRVAGCATAVRFARAGLKVLVLERSGRESKVLSTHTIQDVPGLEDLVTAEELAGIGATRLTGATFWMQDSDLSTDHADHPWVSIRRVELDELLVRAAERAGAEVRFGAKVGDLVWDGGRVVGVRVDHRDGAGARTEIRASLVVGADGRSSTVAKLVGARRYNTSFNERGAAWIYLRGVRSEARFFSQRFDNMLMLATPVENGLTMLAVQPVLAEVKDYRAPGVIEDLFRERAREWVPGGMDWSARLAGAERVDDTRIVMRYPCFLRETAGPGWVLIGDAGYTKDVITGQGISDAMRHAEVLAREVMVGWPNPTGIDDATRRFWRYRDRDGSPMYYLSKDMGREGEITPLFRGVFAHLQGSARLKRQLQDMLGHRKKVRSFLIPPRILGATLKHAARPGVPRAALFTELGSTLQTDMLRRWRQVRPDFRDTVEAAGVDRSERLSQSGDQNAPSTGPVTAPADRTAVPAREGV